ncbi:MAG: aldose 1-epimerase [Ruminococcus sp.]|nr:aldose 1-epimerase [Ruminococcus sp.]MCM1380860.1 aldose 1-epimerase [Muribaculaceae bacterium]MCM1480726.1 aldose 1-epimerase [Muribaculaceae bacterium]
MSEFYAKKANHKGIEAVELAAGGYRAVVAPQIGSNVLRLRNGEMGIEVFRYRDDVSIAEIMNSTEVWGLPTLYLPNRLDGGLLKTSDGDYHLPVNEGKFGNHLHGFLQKRAHKIKALAAEDGRAYVTTEYIYDENDFFYTCFPVKFTAEITVELSEKGMKHTISLTNNSDKMMPISIATHTTINAPFADGGKLENIRLQVPAVKKINFNKRRWLPDGTISDLDKHDKEYLRGKVPVLKNICNDMFTGGTLDLDGEDFRGCIMTDTESGKRLCYEVEDKYKFWIVWNDKGFKNYFCPEPMTAQVNAPNMDVPREESGYTEIAPGENYTVWQRFFVK